MATEGVSRERSGGHPGAWVGMLVAAFAIGAALSWRFGLIGSATAIGQSAGASGSAVELSAIPLPNASYAAVVVDPTTQAGIPTEAAALQAARASEGDLIVGSAPLVRLMQITKTGLAPEDRMDGLYWVILSPDAWVPLTGPVGYQPPASYTTYAWVFIDMSGKVAGSTAISYLPGKSTPPAVPAS